MEATSTASSAASSVDGRSSGGGGSDYLNLGMFSGAGGSQQSDILEGGFSLMNGFGNDLVGSSSVGGTSFDLSDFPTLGGGNVGGAANSGLAAALRQQQQQQQQMIAHQQMMQGSAQGKYRLAMTGNGNFNMASEDFPALSTGSAPNSGVVGPSNGSLLSGPPGSSIGRSQPGGLGMYKSDMDSGGLQLDGASGLLGNTGLGGLGALRGLQQAGSSQNQSLSRGTSAPSASAGAIGSAAGGSSSGVAGGSALSGDYGLLGLLGVIRMTDADRNALALGSDLTLLGLNLGSTEQIYSTFSGPWSDGAPAKEPHFQVRYRNRACVDSIHGSFSHCSSNRLAASVLLHASTGFKNWTFVQIPAGNIVLHFLFSSKGCSTSIRSARTLHKRMEVPWRTKALVQTSRTFRRRSKPDCRLFAIPVL